MPDFDEEAPFEVPMQKIHTSSISSMSSLLLQGYTMLADSCETCGVPLMRKPNSTEVLCVNCGKTTSNPSTSANSNDNGGLLHAPPPSLEEEDIEPAPQPLRERISTPSASISRADPSQALADKMLEGWTLLADHCPRCTTTLVRSKEGQIYCVQCKLQCKQESAAAETQPTQQPRVQTPVPLSTTTKAVYTPMEATVSSHPWVAESVTRNVQAAAEAIAVRMNATAQSLAHKSNREVMDLLDEIRACAAALSELKMALE